MKKYFILLVVVALAGCQTRPLPPATPDQAIHIHDEAPSATKAAAPTPSIMPTVSAAVHSMAAVEDEGDDASAVQPIGYNLTWVFASSGSVTLAWLLDTDTNVVGYNVYFGGASETYTNRISSGNIDRILISNLVPGATYYFAATAHDRTGMESSFSNEAVYTVPALPTPGTYPPVTVYYTTSLTSSLTMLTNVVGTNGCFIPCAPGVEAMYFRTSSTQTTTNTLTAVYP